MDSAVRVRSEIGNLKTVLVHRPGGELSRIIPDNMEDLLFDEIPFLAQAQQEHDAFAQTLREQGAKVLYISDLVEETLKISPAAKDSFVSELIDQNGVFAGRFKEALTEYFSDLSTEAIVKKSIEGLTLGEARFDIFKSGLSQLKPIDNEFIINPLPNLYFARDPAASIGGGVAISHVHYPVRNRETIFTRYIFEFHPNFANKTKFYYKRIWPFSIEGGDILNLSEKVVAVGISQRTSAAAIELLAQTIFTDPSSCVETVLLIEIPKQRNCMHLDTIFTQVDHDKFVIYAETMLSLPTSYVLKRTGLGKFSAHSENLPLDKLLSKYLELPAVELIKCGGEDSMTAAREQWSDGANTLAVAPGVVICYNRNTVTNEILDKKGIKVLEVPSSELSLGRGGPRCMSMPVYRD